jgi:hypothetical protein
VQNASGESFIGRLRDELLNETLFRPLAHTRVEDARLGVETATRSGLTLLLSRKRRYPCARL